MGKSPTISRIGGAISKKAGRLAFVGWRCSACGYLLTGHSGPIVVCPECGSKNDRKQARVQFRLAQARRWLIKSIRIPFLMLLPLGVILVPAALTGIGPLVGLAALVVLTSIGATAAMLYRMDAALGLKDVHRAWRSLAAFVISVSLNAVALLVAYGIVYAVVLLVW